MSISISLMSLVFSCSGVPMVSSTLSISRSVSRAVFLGMCTPGVWGRCYRVGSPLFAAATRAYIVPLPAVKKQLYVTLNVEVSQVRSCPVGSRS
jgi:hypothetical protein